MSPGATRPALLLITLLYMECDRGVNGLLRLSVDIINVPLRRRCCLAASAAAGRSVLGRLAPQTNMCQTGTEARLGGAPLRTPVDTLDR